MSLPPAAPWADSATLARLRAEAEQAALGLRLPLRSHLWRGLAGTWSGVGRGSSVEFQDHRPYLPGDDPRRVDWRAYARSGQLNMKVYREEVSPAVELLLDVSRSMRLDPGKRERVLGLALFALAAARRGSSRMRLAAVLGAEARALETQELEQGLLPGAGEADGAREEPQPHLPPLRPGSLRVWISDCLFAAPPAMLLAPLAAGGGAAAVLAPFTAEEADPDWAGSLELQDAESLDRRLVRFDARRREGYRQAWSRHFEAWRQEARRHAVAFGQVATAGTLLEALRPALAAGALEAAP